jgi:hypothetical protein
MNNDDTTKQFPTEDKLDSLITLVQGMDSRLRSLEEKVDTRLQDTRPIWENVLARLEKIESRLDTIDTRLNRGDSRMDRMESMLFELRADSRDLRDVLKEHFPALK